MIDLAELLRTNGPMSTEAVARALRVSTSAARKRLAALAGLAHQKVYTRRNRNGVFVWFVVGESDVRIKAAVDAMGAAPAAFNVGPRDRTSPGKPRNSA
jgi:predicted transcriptional regulator